MHARTPFHRPVADGARAAQRAVALGTGRARYGDREPTVIKTGKSRGRCPMAVLEHFLDA